MFSMCRGYERSTRYTKLDGSAPRFQNIHEYATTDFPNDQIKIVAGTEWAKQVASAAQKFELDRWEYISEYQTGGSPEL